MKREEEKETMSRAIGVVISSRIFAGVVEHHRLASPLAAFPEDPSEPGVLVEKPAEALCDHICELIVSLERTAKELVVGVALPGIIRKGLVEDSPNLGQLKGASMGTMITTKLEQKNVQAHVTIVNDADSMAAGLAARNNQLDQIVRVWTLGYGIGFGRYPHRPGIWEGGHTVVTLDPKETYCGCGGRGHLEGIMGHRAMRLRFLDMEPEEVFESARAGNQRCRQFVELWHRALAAGTATSIHMDGPGIFYLTGDNLGFLDLNLLKQDLWEMVKMSPLQNYTLRAVPQESETAIVGAAATALQQKEPRE